MAGTRLLPERPESLGTNIAAFAANRSDYQ
jgi:hypothetical protein